eukprot:SAG31_NODE_306_length_17979_cov_7.825447_5_plen_135_part_00
MSPCISAGTEQAGLDFDWEIANDKFGYYSADNPQDFYIGTGPSAEDHLSYTGEGGAGWVYAVTIYDRQLSSGELDAAEHFLACKYGVFGYAFTGHQRTGSTSLKDAELELEWATACQAPQKSTTEQNVLKREDL